jgi:AcrR family transcriptional regulator
VEVIDVIRKTKEDRQRDIINVAVELYKTDGWDSIKSTTISKRLRINHSLILYHFGTIDEVRRRAEYVAKGGTFP